MTVIPLPNGARILVVRLRRIGDILLHTPTLRAIRKAYPSAAIDVLVQEGFEPALAGNPNFDRLIVAAHSARRRFAALRQCARARYDVVLDFQTSLRSVPFVVASGAPVRVGWRKRGALDWAYTHLAPRRSAPSYGARDVARLAAVIGVDCGDDLRLEIAVAAADRSDVASLFARAGIDERRPIVAVSAVAAADRKRWLAERYAAVADHVIAACGAQVVFTSGPGEIPQVRSVVERMRRRAALCSHEATSLAELAAIYERCHLWIGNDGGPKHVATAAGCPTVMITAAGEEDLWSDALDPHQCAVSPADPPRAAGRPLDGVTEGQVIAAVSAMIERLRGEGAFACAADGAGDAVAAPRAERGAGQAGGVGE